MTTLKRKNYSQEVLDLVFQDWTIGLHPEEGGGYFAGVAELPGCMTEADSAAEAVEQLEEARAEWISAALDQGQEIPVATGARDFSGKIFLRVSPDLHRRVSVTAARQGVSMSQWAAEVLAERVG